MNVRSLKQAIFMSDTTLNRILEQCSAFIKDPQNNYMLDVFFRKLKAYGRFSKKRTDKADQLSQKDPALPV